MNSNRLFKWQIKRGSAVILILSFLNILLIVFPMLMSSDNNIFMLKNARLSSDVYLHNVQLYLNSTQSFSYFLAFCMSIFLVVKIFGYLHDRTAVDLINSLPVKRQKLYFVSLTTVLSGIFIVIALYYLSYILILACVDKAILMSLGNFIFMNFVKQIFSITALVMYLLLFMFLLGNTNQAMIFAIGTQFILPIFWIIFSFYRLMFWQDVSSKSDLPEVLSIFSPISLATLNQLKGSFLTYYWGAGIIFLLIFNCYLFIKKPSESAEESVSNSPIYWIVAPATILLFIMCVVGIVITLVQNKNIISIGITAIISGFFAFVIMLLLFNRVKNAWRKDIKYLILALISFALLMLNFSYDFFNLAWQKVEAKSIERVYIDNYTLQITDPDIIDMIVKDYNEKAEMISASKPYTFDNALLKQHMAGDFQINCGFVDQKNIDRRFVSTSLYSKLKATGQVDKEFLADIAYRSPRFNEGDFYIKHNDRMMAIFLNFSISVKPFAERKNDYNISLGNLFYGEAKKGLETVQEFDSSQEDFVILYLKNNSEDYGYEDEFSVQPNTVYKVGDQITKELVIEKIYKFNPKSGNLIKKVLESIDLNTYDVTDTEVIDENLAELMPYFIKDRSGEISRSIHIGN